MNLVSFGISYYISRMRIARFIVRNLSIDGDTTRLMSSSRPEGEQKQVFGEGFEVLLASSYF